MSLDAMKQALEALEAMQSYAAAERKGLRICDEAITALRERLAQPEQELVCMCGICKLGKREWVGLTDEEVSEIINREIGFNSCWGPEEKFARAIEAKLKEKNT